MTLLVARILTALHLLRPSAHPPLPFRLPLRRALLSVHVLNTTYPERIDR